MDHKPNWQGFSHRGPLTEVRRCNLKDRADGNRGGKERNRSRRTPRENAMTVWGSILFFFLSLRMLDTVIEYVQKQKKMTAPPFGRIIFTSEQT